MRRPKRTSRHPRRQRAVLAACLTGAGLAPGVGWPGAATPAAAATTTATWDGSSGNWTDGTRWSTAPVFPNNAGAVTYDANVGGGAVALDNNITIDRLNLSGGSLESSFYTLRLRTGLRVGANSTVTLTLTGPEKGTVSTPSVDIAGGAVDMVLGEMTVAATPSPTVLNRSGLYVGYSGMGPGNLSITGGGRLTNTGPAALGVFSGASAGGTVTVDGPGSSWVNADPNPGPDTSDGLAVGHTGRGVLNVRGGATLQTHGVSVGFETIGTGTVTLDGTGTLHTDTDGIAVGYSGQGTFDVTRGARLNARAIAVGRVAGSSGMMTVSGAGSTVASELGMAIGGFSPSAGDTTGQNGGSGTVTVLDGGRVEAGGRGIEIGSEAAAVGTVTVGGTGSVFRAPEIAIAGSDVASGGQASLTISAGGTVAADQLVRVWGGGVVQYNGGTFDPGALLLRGGGDVLLSPGRDKTLKVRGLDVESSAGSKIDLANNRLVVDYREGEPTEAGNVRALLVAGRAGGTWSGNGITSSSAAADATTALGYAEAAQALGPAGGTFGGVGVDGTALLVRHTLLGDANIDGVVNSNDFILLAANFGRPDRVWYTGDFNYDNSTNSADFVLLAGNFGRGVPGAAAPAGATAAEWEALRAFGDEIGVAVPEPAAPALLLFAAALGARRPGRRTRRGCETTSPSPRDR